MTGVLVLFFWGNPRASPYGGIGFRRTVMKNEILINNLVQHEFIIRCIDIEKHTHCMSEW